ncbi:MAG: hypothetical protein ACE5EO_07550 [Candidatus Krumholzibacteriia bacterium]
MMSFIPTYAPLDESEAQIAGGIVYAVLTNPRIMETVREFHGVSMRCAVIITQVGGEVEEVSVREESQVYQRFPLEPIRAALAGYDMKDSVCMVLVRDRRVCELVASPKSTPSP